MIKFIIGTDTDAGKTYYGNYLIEKGFSVIKPIETGFNSFKYIAESDCGKYAKAMKKNLNEVNLYFFNEPLSPHLAQKVDNREIDVDKLREFILKNKNSYIELAGGLMVPLTENFTQLDLINSFPHCSVDLVIENKLGAINQALLNFEVLKSNKINVDKVIYNSKGKSANIILKENIKTIDKFFQIYFNKKIDKIVY